MPDVLRIVDVNANRAREALRVMEEAARFVLEDAELCAAIKGLRHELAAALAGVVGVEVSRDTPGDVGTAITGEGERHRASVADVAIAAGKRLSEALRVIEEYGKTLGEDHPLPGRVEAMRYRGYEIERRLHAALGSGRRQQWRLCVLLTAALCRDGDWRSVAQAAMAGGADCLQLREKDLDAAELLRRTRELLAMARASGVSIIVNDRPDVALLAGADGVHLGQGDLPVREVRRLVGRRLLIGVSTSRLDEAKQALRDGADYCGVGPMFATTTKQKDVLAGPAYLREYVAWGRLTHLAIGGIDAENVAELVEAGAAGVAVSSAVCASSDPGGACRWLLAALRPARAER
ncbi:MAG: thiamine phosphate synthase [Phycisphaeraceae bacterium]